MIFVIAAYSITLGVLALYGVLLQHRERVYAAAAGAADEGGGESAGAIRGFNPGAMLLAPIWMGAHGMRLPGMVLLGLETGLLWMTLRGPGSDVEDIALLLGWVIVSAASVALGVVGNRIAVRHRGFEGVAAFSASQLPWAISGILLYTVLLPWAWYFLVHSPKG